MLTDPVFNTNDALIPSAKNWSWQDKALCKTNGVDPEIFFHVDRLHGPERKARESAAKKNMYGMPDQDGVLRARISGARELRCMGRLDRRGTDGYC